jgi:hypothetical protein
VRKEVRDLEKNDKLQWNLYLLGLSQFEGLSEELVTSFYQIAGGKLIRVHIVISFLLSILSISYEYQILLTLVPHQVSMAAPTGRGTGSPV